MAKRVRVILQGGARNKALELSKVSTVRLTEVEREFIHLDKLPDGTWRLVYTPSTIPDIRLLSALTLVREDA